MRILLVVMLALSLQAQQVMPLAGSTWIGTPNGGGAPTVVNGCSASYTTTSSACSLSLTSGNTLIVLQQAPITVVHPTCSGGATCTWAAAYYTYDNSGAQSFGVILWKATISGSSGATTITGDGAGNYLLFDAVQVSGVTTGFDTGITTSTLYKLTIGGGPITCNAITPTHSTDLIITAAGTIGGGNATSLTWTSPWTFITGTSLFSSSGPTYTLSSAQYASGDTSAHTPAFTTGVSIPGYCWSAVVY